jgi:hypothetical protein
VIASEPSASGGMSIERENGECILLPVRVGRDEAEGEMCISSIASGL